MFPDSLHVNPSEGDSGASTPPLRHTSPTDSPHGSGGVHWNLSPASRTQAILQGQRQLMNMVRNMPESCYELSLKDLVDLPHLPPPHMLPDDEEERPSVDEYHRKKGYRSGSMGKGQLQHAKDGVPSAHRNGWGEGEKDR